MRTLTLSLILTLCFSLPAWAFHEDRPQILEDSVELLDEMLTGRDQNIPKSLISRARAIVIIPKMLKGGFIFGARYGEGVASVRSPESGAWGAPSFITTAGGSFGFQIGAEAVDLILLIMTEKGIKGLLRDRFTLGADLSLSAGPVGRYAEAGTDILFQGEIYSYSKSVGLFGGISLKGTVVQPNVDSNEKFYRSSLKAKEILFGEKALQLPTSARRFVQGMNRLSPGLFAPVSNEMLSYQNKPIHENIELVHASPRPRQNILPPLKKNNSFQKTTQSNKASENARSPLW